MKSCVDKPIKQALVLRTPQCKLQIKNPVSGGELQDLREQYKLDQEERKLKESQQGASKRTPRMGRQRRLLKKKKKKN